VLVLIAEWELGGRPSKVVKPNHKLTLPGFSRIALHNLRFGHLWRRQWLAVGRAFRPMLFLESLQDRFGFKKQVQSTI